MTVVVERPVAEVFTFCRDFENFPRIVDVFLKVDDFQDGRSHWIVSSAAGHTIEWDAAVTKYVPNSVIAWNSIPGAPVNAGGLMRFAPLSTSSTQLDITLTYLPLRTNLGEAIRSLIHRSNTAQLRSEVAHAAEGLARAIPT